MTDGDSKYKLVYADWITMHGMTVPLANGKPRVISEWIKNWCKVNQPTCDYRYFRLQELEGFFYQKDSGFFFRNTNFLYYFRKHYGDSNVIDIDAIDPSSGNVYLFPIEIEGSNVDYISLGKDFVLEGVNYTFDFKECIPDKLLEYMKAGVVKIVIACLTEPTVCDYTIPRTVKYFSDLGIDESAICFLQGNVRLDYYTRGLGGAKLGAGHGTLQQQAEIANRYPIHASSLGYYCDIVKPEDLDPAKRRQYKFLSWNRTMNRAHRVALCHLAMKHNLLEGSLFSFLQSLPQFPAEELQTLIHVPREEADVIIEQITNLMPYEIDTHHLNDQARESFQTNENNKKEVYANSYIHIVNETQFNSHSSAFLSEKTFRPIVNLQPFIIIGNHHSLEELRRLGFKTFHPFIDETYDTLEDPKERWDALVPQILRFASMSLEEVHEWYYSVQDILLHNHRHFMTLSDFNPLEDFFSTF
mgnify:CR=1 FL=1